MVDDISIESRISVDTSVRPMIFTGSCRRCENNVFNSMDNSKRFQEGLKEGKFHVASEAEVVCLGLIHKKTTPIVPIAEIPTCKGNEYVGESTHAVSFLLSAVEDSSYKFGLDSLLGPLVTFSSDGAPVFRKGAGIMMSDRLPPEICPMYADCPFFNKLGDQKGTTPNCDLDHVGKRNRARGKSGYWKPGWEIYFEQVPSIKMAGYVRCRCESFGSSEAA